MSTNNYSQLCPISFVGKKEIQVSKIDFETCCPCQITACDGGIINVCAKVKFKEGFIFDGDICDIDGGATFRDFTSINGYYIEANNSTCENPVARTEAITKFTDATGSDGIALSTLFVNYAGTSGNAYIQINSCLDQPLVNPPTDPLGLNIIGGTLDRTKNVRIQTDTGTSDAELQLQANGTNGKIEATSAGDMDFLSTGTLDLFSSNSNINVISTVGDVSIKTNNTNAGNGNIHIMSQSGEILLENKYNQISSTLKRIGFKAYGSASDSCTVEWTASLPRGAGTVGTRLTLAKADPFQEPFNEFHIGEKDNRADYICPEKNNVGLDNNYPFNSNGRPGDVKGDVAYQTTGTGTTYFYLCIQDYTNGVASIWRRVQMSSF